MNKTMPPQFAHIKNLKDLTLLKLSGSGQRGGGGGASGSHDDGGADFQCPVTGLEMNGRFRFYCVLPAGLVVSERAVREAKECVEELAGGPGSCVSGNLLPLNGTDEEVKLLREAWEAKRAKKKGKKGKKKQAALEDKRPGLGPKKREFKAVDALPKGASKEVYASIFTSSSKGGQEKETFLCRSTSARGSALT